MQKLERRIAALEAATDADEIRVVRLQIGETQQEARLRCGIPADATNVLFIRRVIIDPVGVRDAEH